MKQWDMSQWEFPHGSHPCAGFGLVKTLSPGLRLCPIPDRHQTEVEHKPDRHCEQRDGDQSVPGPLQIAGLDREDRDHEVIAEPRVPEKGTILRKLSADAA